MQEVPSRPDILERFLVPSECADAVRDTWINMWSLDSDNGKGAEEAVRRAHELVLKPQREGGGNNVYRGNIPPFVAQIPQQDRVAWVAMELIRPPRGVGAYPVQSGTRRVSARVMNELGVFGWALFGEGREVREDQGGWLMRTKAEDVDVPCLQLVCTARTPMRRTLALWLPLHVVIEQLFDSTRMEISYHSRGIRV